MPATATRPDPRSSRRRALLLGCAIAFGTLLAAETVLRLFGFENRTIETPMIVWNPAEDRLMASGAYLYQMDEHALWSPRPGQVIQFGEAERIDGPPELVNADGFRGPRVPLQKTPGCLRIATLGDSSTFGLAVHFEECYTPRLVDELAKRGTKAEVLAAGVDGYTVRQGLERYRSKVRAWKPDVVIAAFGAVNEHWSADESDDVKIERLASSRNVVRRASTWMRNHARVVQALAWVRDPHAKERFLKDADKKRALQQILAQHAGQLDWPGDRRVAIEDYKRFLLQLAREVEADGARFVMIAMPRKLAAEEAFPVLRAYTRAAVQLAAEEKLQILFAHARFRAVEKEGEKHPWFIHDWWHPNPAGHAKIAEWLAPMILDRNVGVGRDVEAARIKTE